MAIHARSGGDLEVMGLMQGKVVGDTVVIIDSFALPVEGTETRVNAQAEAYEYMVQYNILSKSVGRQENVVGWYHSHPGYGCWLSGIDVATQMLNQEHQDPFVAVVVDPKRTVAAGKVEIGAFRTFPKDCKNPEGRSGPQNQSIPLGKVEDFGAHSSQYYPLDVSFFKSSMDSHLFDLLWNRYWMDNLAASKLLVEGEYVASQIADLAAKVHQVEGTVSQGARMGLFGHARADRAKKADGTPLQQLALDCSKLSAEHLNALMSQGLKDSLFNRKHPGDGAGAAAPPMDE